MQVLWSEAARRMLGHLTETRSSAVRSETEAMFSDSIPAEARMMTDGTMVIELSSGTEVLFERIGDGVQVITVMGVLTDAVEAERSFIRKMITES